VRQTFKICKKLSKSAKFDALGSPGYGCLMEFAYLCTIQNN